MNEVFNFEGANIRTVMIDDEPMFVGKDVAEALGYSNTADALSKHVREKHKLTSQITTTGQARDMTVISEPGVYALIGRSKLKDAERFQDWVYEEVLPSIRKTGSYQVQQMSATDRSRLALESVVELDDRVTNLENNAVVSPTDYGVIGAEVSRRVHSYAKLHNISDTGALFQDLNGQIKRVTGAGNRSRIKSKDYEMVIQFIADWTPTTATLTLVKQTELKV